MFISKKKCESILDRLEWLEDTVKHHEHDVVVGNIFSLEQRRAMLFPTNSNITMTTNQVLQQVIEVLGLEVRQVSASTKLVKKKKGKK